ncbi:MAG: two-component system, NarL family, response regulator DevR [Actinomycetota bacterium]|nr:two-component system, NarL family, response regulator DevR [Actinomycetota bacterium]
MNDNERLQVFILDDHEMLRRGLRTMLEEAGGMNVVGEAGTAQEALRQIPALRPQVALLDVQLPDGSGIEVCRQVRTLDPGIKTMMVTTFDDDEARLAAALAGAAGFVSKQIRGQALVTAVRRVAAGEVFLDPTAAAEAVRKARGSRTDPRLASLTGQERRVLDLVTEGLTNREIGHRLGIGEKTVKNYVTAVLLKLGVTSRTQAAVLGSRIVDRDEPHRR